MSYCRFSDDNFKCDVYAYEHCDGWFQIHVAGNRFVDKIPNFPSVNQSSEEFNGLYKERQRVIDKSARVDIDLMYAGESFELNTLEEMKAKEGK